MAERDQELEDLTALLESPGWQRFRAFSEQEWGAAAYRAKARRIVAGLSASPSQTTDAAQLLMQLEEASRAVEQLFSWVIERVKRLQRGER